MAQIVQQVHKFFSQNIEDSLKNKNQGKPTLIKPLYLKKEYTKTHCWNCLRSTQNFAIVPCNMCSGVLFCSEKCHRIAQDTYHK